MQAPYAVFVHGAHLLDVLDGCSARADNIVLTKDEVAPAVFEVLSLRKSNPVVRGVMLESSLLERDRRAWMLVVVFAVAWRVRFLVPVAPMPVPRRERLRVSNSPIDSLRRTILLSEDAVTVADDVQRTIRKISFRILLCDDGDAFDQYAGEREQAASANSPPATDYGRCTCG